VQKFADHRCSTLRGVDALRRHGCFNRDQSPDAHVDALYFAGCARVFTDRGNSGVAVRATVTRPLPESAQTRRLGVYSMTRTWTGMMCRSSCGAPDSRLIREIGSEGSASTAEGGEAQETSQLR